MRAHSVFRGLAGLTVQQWLLLALALLLSLPAGYVGYQRVQAATAPPPARFQTAQVQRGSITATISATGQVVPLAQAKLTFRGSGRVAEVLVKLGDQVTKGQLLARLDDTELRLQVTQAKAALSSAQAKLENIKAGARPEDLAAAQAQLDAARAKLEAMQQGSRPDDLAAAQAAVEAARLRFEQVRAGPTEAELAQAQAAVAQAQAKLNQLLNPSPADVAAAQASVEQARANLAAAQAKLDQLLQPSQQDLQAARAAYDAALAKLNQLKNPSPADLQAAQQAVEQAQSTLAAAQSKLNSLLNPSAADLARAQQAVQVAQAAVYVAEVQLKKDKELGVYDPCDETTGKCVSTTMYNAHAAQLEAAKLQFAQAQATLQQLQSPNPADVQAAQASVAAAESSLAVARAKLEQLKNPSPADLASAQAAVFQAKATLDRLTNPDPRDVENARLAVEQAKAGLAAAEARLNQLLHPSEEDVQAAQAALGSAKAQLAKLQAGPDPADLAAAQSALQQALAQLAAKQQPYTQEELRQQQDAVKQAESNLAKVQNPYSTADIVAAQAAVDQAQAQLDLAQFNLENATLVAPFEGIVGAISMNPGEMVSAQTFITVLDPMSVRVDVNVDETDVVKVRVGMPATVTLEALPDRRLTGRVVGVGMAGTVTQGIVTYPISISVQARDPLPSGITATATITIDQRENVLLVPNRAVRTQGRNRIVEVITGQQPNGQPLRETRQVRAGLSNDQFTEILEGLREGDIVVIPQTTTAAARVPGLGVPVLRPGQ